MTFRHPKHRLTSRTSPSKIALLWGVAVAVVAAGVGIPAMSPASAREFVIDHAIVSDNLNRTTATGWGRAQIGGAYTHSVPARFGSDGAVGRAALPRSGSSLTAALASVSSLDTLAQTVVTLPTLPLKGSGVYAGLQVRSVAGSYYQAQLRMTPAGDVALSILRVNGSTASQMALAREKVVARGFTAGDRLTLEFQVTGTDTVSLSARAWRLSSAKPAWQATARDGSAANLTRPGAVALWSYVSSSTPAQSVGFDDVAAYSLTSAPATTPTPSTPPTQPEPEVTTPPAPQPEPEASTPPATDHGTPPSDPEVPADDAGARGTAGAAPIGSTRYAVPAGALFVATTGSDSAPGTEAAPLGSVQAAITRAKSGSTIVLRAGSYHEGILIPRDKTLTLQPYPGEEVWLDGSRVVANWERSGSAWVSSGWNVKLDSSPTYTRGAPDNTADSWAFVNPNHPMAAHPDQVWLDSTALKQVGSLAQVTTGTFYVNTAEKKLYIGSDPTGHTVRASDTVKAATVLGDNSVLRGIGIRRFAPSVPDMGAVTVYAKGVLLENIAITDNATTGLSLGASGIRLRDVTTARNGMLGAHANYADGLTVSGLLSSGNNTESFNRAPVSGGLKVTRSRGITVSGSAFLNNAGNALWFDESVYDVKATSNDIVGNTGNALVFELSSRLVFADNLVANNGMSGALISDSNQAEVWNNSFTGNARNVNIVQGDRRASNLATAGHDPRQSLPDPTVTWVTGQVTVKNNVLADSTFKCNLCVEDYSHEKSAAQMEIVTDGNVYQRTNPTAPTWIIVWSRGAGDPAVYTTVPAFVKATGQDANSLVLEGEPAITGGSVVVPKVAGAVSTAAQPLPASIATLLGRTAGALQLGAWIG